MASSVPVQRPSQVTPTARLRGARSEQASPVACTEIHLDVEETAHVVELVNRPARVNAALVKAIEAARGRR